MSFLCKIQMNFLFNLSCFKAGTETSTSDCLSPDLFLKVSFALNLDKTYYCTGWSLIFKVEISSYTLKCF